MATEARWRLGRRPELDGLRGIAILLVVARHADTPGCASGGAIGVTMFFTLSGFLITSLLLEESASTGRVDLAAFYRRRALRLFPALFACIAVTIVLAVLLGTWIASEQMVAAALLYFGNWALIARAEAGVLGHTWSLSVEEQFYVTWPLVLVLFGRSRRAVIWLAGTGALVSVGLRFKLYSGDTLWRVAYGTDTKADALLVWQRWSRSDCWRRRSEQPNSSQCPRLFPS
jgi:peptidoglycan/LPS O-acetylase OafA/YrhL